MTVNGKSSFIISWLNRDDRVGPTIASQLEELGPDAMNIVIQMAFKFIETIAFDASWITGLAPDQRTFVDALVEDGINWMQPSLDTLLTSDIHLIEPAEVLFQRV